MFLAGCAFIGMLINIWLMYDDLKNHGGVLYKVDKGDQLAELTLSPGGDRKQFGDDSVAAGELVANEDEMMANAKMTSSMRNQLKVYKEDADARQSLRSSMAKAYR